MKHFRLLLNLAAALAITVAVTGLAFGPALAAQARTVKNYFTGCSGAGCDNILTIEGTQNIAAGGVFDLKASAVFKDAGTDVTTDLRAVLGAGLSAAELGFLDAVTAGTAAASKALVTDANFAMNILRTASLRIGTSGSETTVSATGTELNYVDVTAIGAAQASKALVFDANAAIDILRTASLRIGASGSETTVARTGAEINLLAQGVAAGYKVARGETALDGSGSTTAATGLATIVACTVTMKSASSPVVSTSVLTYDVSTADLLIYPWKVTSTIDNTLVASDGTQTVGWVCIGT